MFLLAKERVKKFKLKIMDEGSLRQGRKIYLLPKRLFEKFEPVKLMEMSGKLSIIA